MLMKGTNVIGLKVITRNNGKQIADVKDIIYDPTENKLTALLTDTAGWFSDAKVIPFDRVESVGEDAIIVQDESAIVNATDVSQRVSNIAKDKTYLTKTRIITSDGKELGTISDIFFHPENGNVEEFEVSQGISTAATGKKRVKVSDIETVGEDATVVKSYVEEDFKEQAEGQGIKGMVNRGKEEAQKAADSAREKYEEVTEKADVPERVRGAKEGVSQTVESVKVGAAGLAAKAEDAIKEKVDQTKDTITEERKKRAVGKYLTVNLLSPNDEVLARRGDMITNELIKKAEEMGILERVVGNTSEEPLE